MPRILTSSKFQAAFLATVISAIPFIFTVTDPNLDRAHKQTASEAFARYIMVIWGAAIGATGLEDAADKHKPGDAGGSAAPDVQVNTGSGQSNSQTTIAVPAQPQPQVSASVPRPAPLPPLTPAAAAARTFPPAPYRPLK